ncbi:hypothetical protein N431DRAFT_553432 [Stipitochalara longipes BDJ]|nr:hypothetical protein N431DRAFT_553432 [Stipitochalara longipes BDJ]
MGAHDERRQRWSQGQGKARAGQAEGRLSRILGPPPRSNLSKRGATDQQGQHPTAPNSTSRDQPSAQPADGDDLVRANQRGRAGCAHRVCGAAHWVRRRTLGDEGLECLEDLERVSHTIAEWCEGAAPCRRQATATARCHHGQRPAPSTHCPGTLPASPPAHEKQAGAASGPNAGTTRSSNLTLAQQVPATSHSPPSPSTFHAVRSDHDPTSARCRKRRRATRLPALLTVILRFK